VGGEKNVTELVKTLGIEQSSVSHSLKVLKDCGIVVSNKKGKKNCYMIRDSKIIKILEISDEVLADIAADLTKCVCD
jgi:ArsR family transcriptional regulator